MNGDTYVPSQAPTKTPVRRFFLFSLSLSLSRTLSLTHCLSPSHLPPPPISHIDDGGGHVRAFVSADSRADSRADYQSEYRSNFADP